MDLNCGLRQSSLWKRHHRVGQRLFELLRNLIAKLLLPDVALTAWDVAALSVLVAMSRTLHGYCSRHIFTFLMDSRINRVLKFHEFMTASSCILTQFQLRGGVHLITRATYSLVILGLLGAMSLHLTSLGGYLALCVVQAISSDTLLQIDLSGVVLVPILLFVAFRHAIDHRSEMFLPLNCLGSLVTKVVRSGSTFLTGHLVVQI